MKTTREEAIRLAEKAKAYELMAAVSGDKGELDAWLECNDETEVLVAIQRLLTLAKNEAFKEAAEVCIAFHEDAERSMFSCCEDAILALIEEPK